MVQITTVLIAIIISLIILLALLVILSGTVPEFKKAIDCGFSFVDPTKKC